MTDNTLDVILFIALIVILLVIVKWSLWAQDRAYRKHDREMALSDRRR